MRDLQAIANTIRRASVNFTLKDGSDPGGLVIENERLQTTTQILNNKIKIQDDEEMQLETLRKKLDQAVSANKQLETENAGLKAEMHVLRTTHAQMETKVKNMKQVHGHNKTTVDLYDQKIETLTLEVQSEKLHREQQAKTIVELSQKVADLEETLF